MSDLSLPPLRLILLRHPFSTEREDIAAPWGATMEALATAHGMAEGHVLALIGGGLIPRAIWRYVTPGPGVEIIFRRVPEKGGKNPLAAILSIASFFVPLAWGPELLAAGALGQGSAAVGLYGALAKGALFLASSALSRPPSQRLGSAGGQSGTTFQLTGGSNKAAPYGVVPRVYGRHRVYPPYAAQPYSETVGGKTYLNMLFDFGTGPLLFEDFRIGSTPIANFTGVEMEVRAGYADDAPMTLYRNDVAPQSLSIIVKKGDGPRIIVTAQACDEVTLGLAFYEGLFAADEQGDAHTRVCIIDLDYRIAGSADPWSTAGVVATLPTDSTAATLISSTATSKIYRTDETTTGKVDVTITVGAGEHWRISTRKYGDTAWVQQAAVDWETLGSTVEGIWVPSLGQTTVNLLVTGGSRADILIAQAANDEVPTAPTVGAIAYKTYAGSNSVVYSSAKTSPVLVSARIVFPARNSYEVRVTRVTDDDLDTTTWTRSRLTWTTLNSIAYTAPVTVTGHALVALRIKATEQLNGVVQEFSAIATALLKTWDGAAWTDYTETRNAAWAYADILSGDANARPIDRARLDTAALEAWADDCAAAGIEFNGVFDFRTTVFEAARDVAATGRASFHMRDGLYSVIQDKAQTVPVQHFTPRNSWNYSASRRFLDLPHAIKVRFLNREKDWQQDERLVPDDGYTEATATRFEVLELFGVDNPAQAWKDGRRYIANARLRPEEHTFYADVEHIVCNRGDLILISHDVPLFGLGYGRIKTVTLNGSLEATAATLDAEIVMEADVDYCLRFRRSDGSSVLASIATVAGAQTAVTFPTPIPAADVPEAGDLYLFGELGSESVELIVTRIEPRADLSAKITCVDAAPAVHTSDSGAIPPWDSQISLPAAWARVPATPVIESVVSDESVLVITPDGGYQSVIQVVISIPAGGAVPPATINVRWRIVGADEWDVMSLPPDSPAIATLPGVAPGQDYAIRVRAMGGNGEASVAAETTHTVVGASTPPAAVTNLLLRNGALMWSHEQPRDHAGYRVRFHSGTVTNWDNAAAAHLGIVTAAPFDIAGFTGGGGVVTFLVKAVDLAGNESETAATLTIGLGDAITDNVILAHDFHPAFAGTITNGAVNAGVLEADDDGGVFWSNPTARFWGLATADFWAPGYLEMTYECSLTPTVDESGPGSLLLSSTITGNGYAIEYKTTGSEATFWGSGLFWSTDTTDAFWTPSPEWSAWPGELTPIPPIEINWRITAYGGLDQGKISALTALIDVPDVVEVLDDVAISSAGTTRLPITAAFRAITSVNLTLQDISTGARTVIAFDKDADLGPLVKAYDDTNTLVNASVDAIIQGY